MTRYCYDTEFLEDGSTIELISIGIVADDGREYYAVNADMPAPQIEKHRWLMANVVPSLPRSSEGNLANFNASSANSHPWPWVSLDLDLHDVRVKPRWVIRNEVRDFLLAGDSPAELWAYYSAYDHVALCQLFGRMIDLPSGIPMYTHDLKQEIDRLDVEPPEQESGLHNALDDARWVHTSLDWMARQVSS